MGEIEACLYGHPDIREIAMAAFSDEEAGVRIRAHVATRDGGRLPIIKTKRFCPEHLPVYMIPDVFSFHRVLPKTSTDKIDNQALEGLG
ncbi:MAG: hypothetical protein O7D94_02205 [Planctomycetota bacterium]|nr:hypothetical protein [Planctomycetota bacterium]MCZ6697725.1 hypothetical protein [Planctomycetota bacterium]